MCAAPRGGMLRNQKAQAATLLHRWQDHVVGWTDIAATPAGQKIIMLSFESLNLNFDETVRHVGQQIGQPSATPVRPTKNVNVVRAGPG